MKVIDRIRIVKADKTAKESAIRKIKRQPFYKTWLERYHDEFGEIKIKYM